MYWWSTGSIIPTESWHACLQESTQGNNFWQAAKRVPFQRQANSKGPANGGDVQDAKPSEEQAV